MTKRVEHQEGLESMSAHAISPVTVDLHAYCEDLGCRAREASRQLATVTGAQKNQWLLHAAAAITARRHPVFVGPGKSGCSATERTSGPGKSGFFFIRSPSTPASTLTCG